MLKQIEIELEQYIKNNGHPPRAIYMTRRSYTKLFWENIKMFPEPDTPEYMGIPLVAIEHDEFILGG